MMLHHYPDFLGTRATLFGNRGRQNPLIEAKPPAGAFHYAGSLGVHVPGGGSTYEKTSPLTRRPFSMFVRQVNPEPPPTPREFYWENLKSGVYPSYVRGFHRYFHMLKEHPGRALFVVAGSTILGALMTAFHKYAKIIEGIFILALMGYPVITVFRQVPKMQDAYELANQGNPTQAKKKFEKALDECTYKIGHVYLKPLTFAFLFAMALALPRRIRDIRQGVGMFRFLKPLLTTFRIQERLPVLRHLDQIQQSLTQMGLKTEQFLRLK